MSESDNSIITLINSALLDLVQGKISKDFLEYKLDNNINYSKEIIELFQTVKTAITKFDESYDFINSLSKGELEKEPPLKNSLIAPYKQLHSNLRHLTWQTQQIATGDYGQKVSFLGDFSNAFNLLIQKLKDKKKLEDDLKASEKNLRELNSLKDKMFSIIAHDLRGPVGNYTNLIDIILDTDDFSDTSQIKEYLKMLQKSSGSVYNLLENLLNWARSQRNEIHLTPSFFKLNDIFEENLILLSPKAKHKKINLHSVLSNTIIGYFDYQTINLVVRNLISNALKFTPRDGEVKIDAYKNSNFIDIVISDTGIGIKTENLPTIFNPVQHFATKGTDNESGSGLGLLLCKDFVEKNGGKISADSQPGIGSTFTFSVPACG